MDFARVEGSHWFPLELTQKREIRLNLYLSKHSIWKFKKAQIPNAMASYHFYFDK